MSSNNNGAVTKPRDLIEPRIASYVKSSWYIRWVVMAAVIASYYVLPHGHHPAIWALLPFVLLYNGLLLPASRRGWTRFTNQTLMIILDSVVALLLIIFSGGITSPYVPVLAFMVVSGGYWYGMQAALTIGILQTVALFVYELVRGQQNAGTFKVFLLEMLLLTAIGVYVSWLTQSERSERNKLITLGTETEKERQQLLALINNMQDAVLVINNDDHIAIYNQAAALLAGATSELHNAPVNDALHFLDGNNQRTELKIGRIDSTLERKDLRVRAADGSLVNVSINIAPYIVDRQNRGHVLIIRDTTQEKTIDKEREEFIAVASHELRTPLTIAQGNLSFLLSPPYLPEKKESVDMVNSALRSLQQLSHIISDLTNLSKVESEELDVQLEPLNPIALLHEFESDYNDQARGKGLDLQVNIDPNLSSATILTSRYVVREIIEIYITNALKFTEKGSITLSVMNPTDGSAGVTFSVADTGIGISHSDQKKLFEKFFQSEEYATRVHGGTGLGLYIARSLANRITARVWFETELGKGSTFYLWVPPYSRHKQDSDKVAAAETKDFFNNV